MRSAARRAGARSPVKASSITLRDWAWWMVSGRSQPEMCRSVAYLRRARAKEPPIRPVPRMVARVIRCGDMRRRNDNAERQRAQRCAEKKRVDRRQFTVDIGEKIKR